MDVVPAVDEPPQLTHKHTETATVEVASHPILIDIDLRLF
jgi:hypothetical protein